MLPMSDFQIISITYLGTALIMFLMFLPNTTTIKSNKKYTASCFLCCAGLALTWPVSLFYMGYVVMKNFDKENK